MHGKDLSWIFLAVILSLSSASFLVPEAAAAQRPAAEAKVNEAEVNRAKAAQAKHQPALMKQPGVHGVGVGLMDDGKRTGIHIYVGRGQRSPGLPTQLENVPVRIIEAGPFKAHDGPCDSSSPCHVGEVALPVQMGNSTSNDNGDFAGTLGFRVKRRGDPSVGYITNNHVAAASGPNLCPAQINPEILPAFETQQCQPGKLDAGGVCLAPPIGNLVQVVPLIMGGEFLNTVDAAFVQSNRGCVSKTIRDIGNPTAKAVFPKLNSTLRLSGRTSGFRRVRVVTINVTVIIDYDVATCGEALFVNQAITEPVTGLSASLPGDSGAPLVNSDRQPVGLNFAGDGFVGIITPMPLVLNALGVQIDTAPNEPPAATCP
jgi:hypothetical protein